MALCLKDDSWGKKQADMRLCSFLYKFPVSKIWMEVKIRAAVKLLKLFLVRVRHTLQTNF